AAGAINRRNSRFHQDAPAAGDSISCGSSALARCHRHRLLKMLPHHPPTLPVTVGVSPLSISAPRTLSPSGGGCPECQGQPSEETATGAEAA
ncbi:unnamed protein product, partial [Rangifer tarandus platyrhynchus]